MAVAVMIVCMFLPNVWIGVCFQCNTGQWSGSPLVCETTCVGQLMPTDGGACVKTVIQSTFADPTELKYYVIVPQVPAGESAKFWNVSASACLYHS